LPFHPRPGATLVDLGPEGESQMIKLKRSAEQQVADEADRKALNPLASRQTISASQAEPEFQENGCVDGFGLEGKGK
jgi:hypothetical protein